MRRSAILLSSLALLAAGCGGDDEPEPSGSGGAEAPATEAAPAGGDGDKVVVQMTGIAYEPAQATVKVGQTVEWVNEDPVQHDVESTAGEKIDSELFDKGETFEFTPKEAGTIEYFCTIHPNMKGTLTVTE